MSEPQKKMEESVEKQEKVNQEQTVEPKKRKPRKDRVAEGVVIFTDKIPDVPEISHSKAVELTRKPRVQTEAQKASTNALVARAKQRKADRLAKEALENAEKIKEQEELEKQKQLALAPAPLRAYKVKAKRATKKKTPIVLREQAKKDLVPSTHTQGKESDDENDDYDSDEEPQTSDGTRKIRKTISKIAEIDTTIKQSIQVNPYAELLKRYYV